MLVPATRAQDDPLNLAYIPAAPTRAAVAFDLATSAANIFAGMWEAGAGAIHAENEALAWLVGLLGWPETAGGTFVSGGTMGNLSALVTARETMLARRGYRPDAGWALACTSDAHSSIRGAARALDVAVVEVPQTPEGHMSGVALREVLAANPNVFAVVASAGTTNAGIVDDLADVGDACDEFDVWMHVDGAYGGAALAAPSVRHRFTGVERANSFIVDPHKWLFAPYDCCALLYREPQTARAAHSQKASYLDHIDREEWNPADLATHLSRRARGLPFWFSLAVHGTDRYSQAIERTLAIAREVADGIDASDHLRLVRPRSCPSCCSSAPDGIPRTTRPGRGERLSRGRSSACRRCGAGRPSCAWRSSTRRRALTGCSKPWTRCGDRPGPGCRRPPPSGSSA